MYVGRGASCVVALLIGGGIIIYFGQSVPKSIRVFVITHPRETHLTDGIHAVLPAQTKTLNWSGRRRNECGVEDGMALY